MSEARDTTFDERATWGTCPVCAAPHGEWCDAEVGIQLGARPDGTRLQTGGGVHLARIKRAPMRVRLVGVDHD